MITVKVPQNEINRIANKARMFSKQVKGDVAKDLAASAYAIDAEQKKRVQGGITDKGGLISGIRAEPAGANGLRWVNRSTTNYSAYIEFGTGRLVDLSELVKAGFPATWALKYKGRGIKKLNLQPRPFFFPAINEETPKLIKTLRETLKRNGKNF